MSEDELKSVEMLLEMDDDDLGALLVTGTRQPPAELAAIVAQVRGQAHAAGREGHAGEAPQGGHG